MPATSADGKREATGTDGSVAGAPAAERAAQRSAMCRWDWLPVPAAALAIFLQVALDLHTHFEPPHLLSILNGLIFAGAAAAAALAGWGYLATGAQTLLLLGGGMLSFGLASVAAAGLVHMGRVDLALAAHNPGTLVAGAFHLAGAVRILLPPVAPGTRRLRVARIVNLYALSVALLSALTALAVSGHMPRFVIEGGTTPVRSSVLALAVAVHLFSALLFAVQERGAGAVFVRWYWLGLSLIGLGLAAVAMAGVGTPLGWTGRLCQALGQLYILLCLVAVLRQRRAAGLPAAQSLGLSFRRFEMEHSAIWEAAAEGIVVADERGTVLSANCRVEEILGLGSEELVGLPISRILSPRASSEEQARLGDQLLREGQRGLEFRCGTRDGADVAILVNSSVLRDRRGRVSQVVAMVSDITERKRAEEALRGSYERLQVQQEELVAVNEELQVQQEELTAANEELATQSEELQRSNDALRLSEQRYRSLFESMSEGFVAGRMIYDEEGRAVDYQLVEANPGYARLTGMPHEESLRKTMKQLIPTLEPSWVEWHARVAETGEPQRWESDNAHTGKSFEMYTYRPAPGMFASLFVETTERKRAEAALRESEERFRAMADGTPLMIWVHDAEGRIEFVNGAYREFFGVTADQVREAGWQPLVHPEDAPAYTEAFLTSLRERKPFRAQARVRRADGEWRWVDSLGSPRISPSGEFLGMAGSSPDITDRKEAEEAVRRANEALRDADRRKDEFLAMLAHELRNPLAAISGAVQLLQMRGGADPMQQRAQDAAARQTRHMARLLDDLLDVSRVTRGKVELKREPLDLALAVESGVEAVRPLIEAKGHRFFTSLPHGALRVDGDAVRLAQIVTNLLSNAAKYTPPGGEIHLSLHAEGGEAVIRARDNGAGIAPELLPRVFDLFVQEDRSPDRAQGGLGIGLTMVRSLAELHGGRVEALSEGPGKGSEFIVRFPALSAAPETAGAGDGSGDSEARVPCPPRRILIVDDNADAAEMLAMALEQDGHAVATAHSGPAGIDLATAYRPDVALLDIGMPGMDGYEVARRLREDPALSGALLVALTGYGQDEDRERALAAGFDHHLVKPVEPEALLRVLAEGRTGMDP